MPTYFQLDWEMTANVDHRHRVCPPLPLPPLRLLHRHLGATSVGRRELWPLPHPTCPSRGGGGGGSRQVLWQLLSSSAALVAIGRDREGEVHSVHLPDSIAVIAVIDQWNGLWTLSLQLRSANSYNQNISCVLVIAGDSIVERQCWTLQFF